MLDNPVAAFRWVTGCALMWILLFVACAPQYILEDSPQAETCLAPPVFYEGCAAVRAAYLEEFGVEARPTTCGYYSVKDSTIHMPRPTDDLPLMCLAGHELYHHWFGTFH